MKIIKTIFTAAVLMAAVCLPAQNKSAGINLSFWKDICTQPYDSTTALASTRWEASFMEI